MRLFLCEQEERELLEDLYSLSGDALEPVREALDVYSFEESEDARESVRLQITLPKDAPPVDTVLGVAGSAGVACSAISKGIVMIKVEPTCS